MAYLGIHGVVDDVLPIDRGRALRDRYLGVNGCQSKDAPEPGPGSSNSRVKTTYDCRDGYPVWWIAHGGGHVGDSVEDGANWFAAETWDFFTRAIGDGGDDDDGGGDDGGDDGDDDDDDDGTPGNCSPRWGQCGGSGWSGPTCCEAGSTCQAQNQWYSQCI